MYSAFCDKMRKNILTAFPVADLRGQVGATAPRKEGNTAWRSLFGEKCAPRRNPKTLFFNCFDQSVGQTCKS